LCPLRGLCGAALDNPALVRAYVREIGRVERTELDELLRQPLSAAHRSVGVDELDPLPAITLVCLEDRTDLDLDPCLLANLAGERVLQSFAGREKAAEETPLGCTESVTRQDHVATRVYAEAHHADEEPRLRAIQEAPLPTDRKRIEERRENAKKHAPTLRPPLPLPAAAPAFADAQPHQ